MPLPLLATTPLRSHRHTKSVLSASTRMPVLALARGVLLGAITRSLLRHPAQLVLPVTITRTVLVRMEARPVMYAVMASTHLLETVHA